MNKEHALKPVKQNTIFVDCFQTVILRKLSTKQVLKLWAENLEDKLKIDWKEFYKTYNKINFKLSFKKLITKFVLEEKFEVVLLKVYEKLSRKYKNLNAEDFVAAAIECYIQAEKVSHYINENFISFLRNEKAKGKKIFIVSDFYCSKEILTKWLVNLGVADIFENIFSSYDFDKEKATTKLYKHLLKDLNLKAKDVVMFGDNVWSDVLMSRLCGLHARRIKY